MIKLNELSIGTVIRIFMENGQVFYGSIKENSYDGIVLASLTDKNLYTRITKLKKIQAYSYIIESKNQEPVIEKPIQETIDDNRQDQTPRVNSVTSLVSLRQLKALEEKDKIKRTLTADTCTAGAIEYGSQFDALLQSTKRSGK